MTVPVLQIDTKWDEFIFGLEKDDRNDVESLDSDSLTRRIIDIIWKQGEYENDLWLWWTRWISTLWEWYVWSLRENPTWTLPHHSWLILARMGFYPMIDSLASLTKPRFSYWLHLFLEKNKEGLANCCWNTKQAKQDGWGCVFFDALRGTC